MIQWIGEQALRSGRVRSFQGLAIRWAVQQLTGEKFPELQPVAIGKSGWFLEPINLE
jgi:hypothetical protein